MKWADLQGNETCTDETENSSKVQKKNHSLDFDNKCTRRRCNGRRFKERYAKSLQANA
jgi:hypothetical protein